MTARTQLLDDRAIGRALVRMASEIVERFEIDARTLRVIDETEVDPE